MTYIINVPHIPVQKDARVVQLVRTLISCINNENSNFSPGTSY
jgi:hypothetical protein